MKKKYYLIFLIILGTITLFLGLKSCQPVNNLANWGDRQLILPNQEVVSLKILTTDQEQYQGFSNQLLPCADCGLLFLWSQLEQPTMVMRDMLFSLDFIWLKNQEIVKLTSGARPELELPYTKYQPGQLVDAVIEVPAGFISRHGLQVGQKLDWY